MTIIQSISKFQANIVQCDSLISSAHKQDAAGNYIFAQLDREQITVAAFLNLFIAWEEFIESSIIDFMMGDPTTSGTIPVKYVQPTSHDHSNKMLVHTLKYFDYANYENVRRIAKLYFENGYPFEPVLSGINAELSQMKIIRNACAHLSSTTKVALEGVAQRLLGQMHPGISVYDLLMKQVRSHAGVSITIYALYRDKLDTAATLIAKG